VIALISEFRAILIKLAKRHLRTIIPGYTHLQRAQPVTLAHHILAYVEMLGATASDLSRRRRALR